MHRETDRAMIRILLAEDDQVMREYLTRALERSSRPDEAAAARRVAAVLGAGRAA